MSRVPGSLVSPELLDQIYRVVREVLRDSGDVAGGQAKHRGNPAFIAYTTSTISARSGTTPGTGTAEIRYLTDAGVYAASGDERTVYSHAEATIANGSYVLVAMCGGRLEIANGSPGFCDNVWAAIPTATPTSSDYVLFVQTSTGCVKRGAMGAC